MSNASYSYQWLMVDTTDPYLTEVYVLLEAHGDCPIGVEGWHHKTFSARMPTVEILEQHIAKAVTWPLESPPWIKP